MTTTVERAHRTRREGAVRIAIALLAAGIACYAVIIAIAGATDLVTQAMSGVITTTMQQIPGSSHSISHGSSGNLMVGAGESQVVSVYSVNATVMFLHVLASSMSLATHLVLVVVAIRLLVGLRAGRPFDANVTRGVLLASMTVLALGVAGQLLAWRVRLEIIDDFPDFAFSRDLQFEPSTVTVGLTLALVAVAFRTGTRLQRDTEGLV